MLYTKCVVKVKFIVSQQYTSIICYIYISYNPIIRYLINLRGDEIK